MATQKELLDALKLIKNHCEEHRKKVIMESNGFCCVCNTCMLRNSYGECGLLKESDDVRHNYPTDWDIVEPEYPKLFTY